MVLSLPLASCENLDDRYTTVFHPVVNDARVSIPAHVKRFSIKMFAFTRDKAVLKDQVRSLLTWLKNA